MGTWFTADTHASHDLMLKERPFSDVEAMNRALAHNINACVHRKDTLFHLGDFSFGGPANAKRFREMLEVSNIVLIRGNHDVKLHEGGYLDDLFSDIRDMMVIKAGRTPVVLSHYPYESWPQKNYGSIHLHGHCHGKLEHVIERRHDVGVDCNNLMPVALEDFLP